MQVNLANGEQVQGTLPVANGGSGQNTYPSALVGQVAQQTLVNTRLTQRVLGIAGPGATPSINSDNYDAVNLTAITAAITSMSTNWSGTPTDFQDIMLRFTSTAAQSITWGAKFASSGVATLPTTTVAGKTITVGLIYNTAKALWYCMAVDATGY